MTHSGNQDTDLSGSPSPSVQKASQKTILTRIVAICFLTFSIMVILISHTYSYYSATGPGPGFFPLWLGFLMLALSIVWVIQLIFDRTKVEESEALLPKEAILYITATFASSLAYVLLLPLLGYPITMSLYLTLLFLLISAMKIVKSAIWAVIASLASHYLLTYVMGIQLPRSPFAFLKYLGL